MFIKFVKDEENNLNIEIDIDKGGEEEFADILFGISNGAYLPAIEQTLLQMDNDTYVKVVNKYTLLRELYNKLSINDDDDVVVDPTEFLSLHSSRGGNND